jgi:hypothetical protein
MRCILTAARAFLKTSATAFSLSPTYLEKSSGPTQTHKRVILENFNQHERGLVSLTLDGTKIQTPFGRHRFRHHRF